MARRRQTGTAPTAADDVVIPNILNLPFIIVGNINIKSLTITKSLNLMAPNPMLTFTATSITIDNMSSDFAASQIVGFSSVTVSNMTINASSSTLVSFTIQNAVINGAVNTNSQDLVLTGMTILNSGCSFSGNAYNSGVLFNTTALTINAAISMSCRSQFPKGTVSGSGSLTFSNDARPSFGSTGLGATTIQVPITINNTVPSITPQINCGNVIFENTVSINAATGSNFYWHILGSAMEPLVFKNTLTSNRSFDIRGSSPNALVKFDGATVNIDGTTNLLTVYTNANIVNSTFNDDTWWLATTDFNSGTFNAAMNISNSLLAGTFNIKSSGAKSILGYVRVEGILNWEAGVITKSSNTFFSIAANKTFNIYTADGFSSGYEGQLTNDGIINYSCATTNTLLMSMRTVNRSTGVINVINLGPISQFALRSYQNDGTLTVQKNSWLVLGGENHVHNQNGTITGFGNLAFSLGNHNLSTHFSSGNLEFILCFAGYYLSGSGSITTTASTTLRLLGGSTTIPITLNGVGKFFNPKIANTIIVNDALNLESSGPNMTFGTNGKINISATGIMAIASNGNAALEMGATNTEITNCGTIICNANYNFNVPYTTCSTSKIKGTGALYSTTGHKIYDASPGSSPGTLTLNPSVTSDVNAIFNMEIWNTGTLAAPALANDLLASDGNIQLAGTLNILTAGVIPIGSYTIIQSTSGSVSGGFTAVNFNGGALPPSVSINYTSNTVNVYFSAVLSAELLAFKAQNTEGGNLLTWQTASEVNTSHFDIERSNDGLNFEKIGETKAQGKAATYEFFDRRPLNITTYYRLKINDLDNKSSYSKVVSLSPKGKGLNAKIFPNPFRDNITIDVSTDHKTALTIDLTDILGRSIQHLSLNTEGSLNLPISTNDLSNGVYFIKISDGQTVIQQRIVKQ